MKSAVVGITALSIGASQPAASGDPNHPGFAGRWQLDVAASAYEQGPGPRVQVDDIATDHGHVVIDVTSVTRDITVRYKFSLPTDGRTIAFSAAPRVDPSRRLTTASARWDGEALIVDSALATDDGPFRMIDRYRLSDDGRRLSVRTERGDGRLVRTLVFLRTGRTGAAR